MTSQPPPAIGPVLAALGELVRTRGPDLLGDLDQLRAALRDFLPGERRAIDAVIAQLAAVSPAERARRLDALRHPGPGAELEPTRTANVTPPGPAPALHEPPVEGTGPRRRRMGVLLVALGAVLAAGLLAAGGVALATHPTKPRASTSNTPTNTPADSATDTPTDSTTSSGPTAEVQALQDAFSETTDSRWGCQEGSEDYGPGARYVERCTLVTDDTVEAVFTLWSSVAAENQNANAVASRHANTKGFEDLNWSQDNKVSGRMFRYPENGKFVIVGYYSAAPYSYVIYGPTRARALQVWASNDLFPLYRPTDLPTPPPK